MAAAVVDACPAVFARAAAARRKIVHALDSQLDAFQAGAKAKPAALGGEGTPPSPSHNRLAGRPHREAAVKLPAARRAVPPV
jgi:hypothetical protein